MALRGFRAALLSGLLCMSSHIGVHAGFYVCPSPCAAMLLPQDMETLADCLCPGNISGLLGRPTVRSNAPDPGMPFRCPSGSAAIRLGPTSFQDCKCILGYMRDELEQRCVSANIQCQGRYQLKQGIAAATSLADCDCRAPYEKDDTTGKCTLRECPRAGNYVAKSAMLSVASLADCACLAPLVKNDQSGECLHSVVFECPAHAQPTPNLRPQSFADCHCDFGFVRTPQGTCVVESAVFACPQNSFKRKDLPLGARAQSFADCECLESGEFTRNDLTHSCDRIPSANDDTPSGAQSPPDFTCPAFAIPIAPMPHSIEQCQCLPGYGWKTPEMTCVRLSGYRCPRHAYKRDPALSIEQSFSDCECAHGFFRDDATRGCLEWFLANSNGCPPFAYLKHWPLQSRANCKCIYGQQAAASSAPVNADMNTTATKKPTISVCASPPIQEDGSSFSQCPDHSFASNWPAARPSDCSCFAGYVATTESSPQCVEAPEPTAAILAAIKCRAPLVKNPFTGECRLPLEQVLAASPALQGGAVPTHGTVLFKGLEYEYVLTQNNTMVIQGDIAIGELKHFATADGTGQKIVHVLHGYYNAERDHRWRDAQMCYQIDASASAMATMLKDAMRHIQDVTGFQFLLCDQDDCHLDKRCQGDFLRVTRTASSCFSYIGRIGGPQLLGVSADCGVGNLQHVLLHALGMHHTIDRMDRDAHVRIAWECIAENARSNFVIEQLDANDTASELDAPYDFFSIMHHPADAFLATSTARRDLHRPKWCQPILPIIADHAERVAVLSRMGQREKLAVTDIHAVWRLYPMLQQREKPVYQSRQEPNVRGAPIHESRLHTKDDVIGADMAVDMMDTDISTSTRSSSSTSSSRLSKKLSSFFGGMVVLLGFGAVAVFALMEFRKRMLAGNGAQYYSESLLTDPTSYH